MGVTKRILKMAQIGAIKLRAKPEISGL